MPKILIVFEEDAFLGNVINDIAKKEGYQTLLLKNAGAALDQMKVFSPSVVILDMELESTDAFKLLEKKQTDASISDIPVIIASPVGDVDEIRKAVDLKVKDYIVKSQFNAEELISKLKSILNTGGKEVGSSNLLKGKKVMWVEDDQFLSDLIARKLTQHNCKLIFSKTGEEALDMLSKERPDIILLDLLLPGISGLDVLQNIKSNENLKNIPVIILSNFTQNHEIEKTKAMGAERFLTKATVVLDDIIREMQDVLAKSGKH
jgi:DNA-binding response OmpR family regulator